mmetsp:Transcript_93574/g.301095  ORF Transcript_93574/g.301095 Transcript_93574/m.301095 type:complete len:252 (-) Transcript_93574:4-759(-)
MLAVAPSISGRRTSGSLPDRIGAAVAPRNGEAWRVLRGSALGAAASGGSVVLPFGLVWLGSARPLVGVLLPAAAAILCLLVVVQQAASSGPLRQVLSAWFPSMRVSGSPQTVVEQAPRSFLVDNRHLAAGTCGLFYRSSPDEDDAAGEDLYAEWGSVVVGVDCGNGWLRAGDLYLPLAVCGTRVLLAETLSAMVIPPASATRSPGLPLPRACAAVGPSGGAKGTTPDAEEAPRVLLSGPAVPGSDRRRVSL